MNTGRRNVCGGKLYDSKPIALFAIHSADAGWKQKGFALHVGGKHGENIALAFQEKKNNRQNGARTNQTLYIIEDTGQ